MRQLIERGQRDGFLHKTSLNVRGHREESATSCPGTKVTDAQLAAWQKAVNA